MHPLHNGYVFEEEAIYSLGLCSLVYLLSLTICLEFDTPLHFFFNFSPDFSVTSNLLLYEEHSLYVLLLMPKYLQDSCCRDTETHKLTGFCDDGSRKTTGTFLDGILSVS